MENDDIDDIADPGPLDDSDEPSTSPESGDELRKDVEEAVASQKIAKGDSEPYKGLRGRTDNAPGGMFEGCDEFAKEAAKNGTTLKAALSDYHGIEKALRVNPINGMNHICKRLGLSPQKVAEAMLRGAQPQTQQSYQAQQYQQQQSHQAQAEYLRHAADIETAKKTMPFFDSLRPAMVKIAQSGRAHTVKQAYDAALKVNPSLGMSAEIARRDAIRDKQMGRGKRR